jgi:hypothetical protein
MGKVQRAARTGARRVRACPPRPGCGCTPTHAYTAAVANWMAGCKASIQSKGRMEGPGTMPGGWLPGKHQGSCHTHTHTSGLVQHTANSTPHHGPNAAAHAKLIRIFLFRPRHGTHGHTNQKHTQEAIRVHQEHVVAHVGATTLHRVARAHACARAQARGAWDMGGAKGLPGMAWRLEVALQVQERGPGRTTMVGQPRRTQSAPSVRCPLPPPALMPPSFFMGQGSLWPDDGVPLVQPRAQPQQPHAHCRHGDQRHVNPARRGMGA